MPELHRLVSLPLGTKISSLLIYQFRKLPLAPLKLPVWNLKLPV